MSEQPNGPLDAHTEEQLADAGGEFEPDFTDQPGLSDPTEASGAGSSGADDPAESGEVYTPPMDPVVTTDAHGAARVLGCEAPGSHPTPLQPLDTPRTLPR